MECKCCFTEIPPRKHVKCSADNPHVFCRVCPRRTLEAEMESGNITFKCIGDAECTGVFTEKEQRYYMSKHMVDKVSLMVAKLSISKAGIEGIVYCPHCPNAVVADNLENDIFECTNPSCLKATCMKCQKDAHAGHPCNTDAELESRKEREEEATMRALVRCPKCTVSISKTRGCNRVKCICGTYICYVCGVDISEVGYTHFKSTDQQPTYYNGVLQYSPTCILIDPDEPVGARGPYNEDTDGQDTDGEDTDGEDGLQPGYYVRGWDYNIDVFDYIVPEEPDWMEYRRTMDDMRDGMREISDQLGFLDIRARY